MTMKGSRNQNNLQSKQNASSNRPVPDVRDNLDSRKNLEHEDAPRGHNKKNDSVHKPNKKDRHHPED